MNLESNKTSNITAILAMITAIMALFISIRSEYNKEKEEIGISISRISSNITIEPQVLMGNLVIPTYWSFTLSNNSQKPVSIIDVDFKCINSNQNIVEYSGLYQGIFEEVDKETELPINLESGKSIKPIFKIGIMTTDSSIIRFKSSPNYDIYFGHNKQKWRRYNQVLEDFAKEGVDFFGNCVEAHFENEKMLMYTIHSPIKDQRIIVKFALGSGSIFEKEFGFYGN